MKRLAPRLAAISTGAVLGLLPTIAYACPVCFSAQNESNRVAFVMTTMFLTLLPLAMLTLGLRWAWRRMRQQDADQLASVTAPAEAPPTPSVPALPTR